jgi:FdhD protein
VGRVTTRRRVERIDGTARTGRPETLVVEEPLEIRVVGRPLSVTMRTPGDDFDLVTGFLTTEGITTGAQDIVAIRYCAGATVDGENTYNVVDVTLADGVSPPDASLERSFYTTSSCGVCGKASIDAIRTQTRWPVAADHCTISSATLAALPESLREAQRVFDRTGGLHAAGLFTTDGELRVLREDVGRHNAVDKVIGWAAREALLPLRDHVLMVSGRVSFELTQKALMAGIPVLAAVSAPSSLAVDLAADVGMTVVGFLRGQTMNVYSGGERIVITA